ncbi:MAG: hypothetical protein EP332_12990 [Bacteroidetes bacterium]|nr:MAG: hypothetical protein EP332_12990 [Bacteroidota bacterium]
MKNVIITALFSVFALFSIESKAQCIPSCGTWTVENKTGCELELFWETPPPCTVILGAGTLAPNSGSINLLAPCIGTDCGPVCPWALRVKNTNFSLGAHDPSGTVYYNVIPCSKCPSGWIKATYLINGSGSYSLIFECQ